MPAWEQRLLGWAYAGAQGDGEGSAEQHDHPQLAASYEASSAITREQSKTFFLASGLLPAPKRAAVRALYGFCRRSDDLLDRPVDQAGEQFGAWRDQVMGMDADQHNPDLLAWTDTRRRFGIPSLYVEQFLDGLSRDLTQQRYDTFADLAEYCYGAASTVGLMAMHIVGFDGPQAIPYAVKLGVALQLTNILRDVGEDWAMGRVYLPLKELEAHGLSEDDIAAGRLDDRWQALMRFQIARVRRLYAESIPGLRNLHRDGRFAIAAAAELYRAILDDIEAHGMDVFSRRAHVGSWGKLRRLPAIWWRSGAAR